MSSIVDIIDWRDTLSSAPLTKDEFALRGHPNIGTGAELIGLCVSSQDPELPHYLYQTRMHSSILDVTLTYARSLIAGRYLNTIGESGATVIGPRGIGKSCCLKAFVRACPLIVPDLHTIYISYNHGTQRRACIASIVVKRLRLMGVCVPEYSAEQGSLVRHLVMYLQSNHLKVLILVDEIDLLYKNCNAVSETTVHDIAALSNQSSGTVFVLLCGSATVTDALLASTGNQKVRQDYPLLQRGLPNVNKAQRPIWRVHAPLPTELATAAHVAGVENSAANRVWLRCAAFAGGCSIHSTHRFLRMCTDKSDMWESGLLLNPVLDGTGIPLSGNMAMLYRAFLSRMYTKNQALLRLLWSRRKCTLYLDKIMTVPWEERFVPLTFEEAREAWKGLLQSGEIAQDAREDMWYTLYCLADSGWLVLSSAASCMAPHLIYPCSIFRLVAHAAPMDMRLADQSALWEAIRAGPGEDTAGILSTAAVVTGDAQCCAVM